jgi:hypothetical protein
MDSSSSLKNRSTADTMFRSVEYLIGTQDGVWE